MGHIILFKVQPFIWTICLALQWLAMDIYVSLKHKFAKKYFFISKIWEVLSELKYKYSIITKGLKVLIYISIISVTIKIHIYREYLMMQRNPYMIIEKASTNPYTV